MPIRTVFIYWILPNAHYIFLVSTGKFQMEDWHQSIQWRQGVLQLAFFFFLLPSAFQTLFYLSSLFFLQPISVNARLEMKNRVSKFFKSGYSVEIIFHCEKAEEQRRTTTGVSWVESSHRQALTFFRTRTPRGGGEKFWRALVFSRIN